MQTATIRRLGPGDEALFSEMNALFGKVFEDEQTYTGAPPSPGYVANFLSLPHVHALVAHDGDEMVGALVAYELEKFERERREIYIYDLAVAEHCRRRGIATALIEKLGEIATERGAWVIYVQADYGDDPAIALYTKLGTREDVMHFDIPVKPQPS